MLLRTTVAYMVGDPTSDGPTICVVASENSLAVDAPRLRAQWLDDKGQRVRIAFQPSSDQAWDVEEARADRLVRYWKLVHVEDVREWSEFDLRARAARREWGHEGGFAEWTLRLGTRRFPGDLLRAVDN